MMKFGNALQTRLVPTLGLALTAALLWSGFACGEDGGLMTYPGMPGSPGPVVFSHLSHGDRGAGFTCDKCHPAESGNALNVTMNDIREGRACGSCHDGRTKGSHAGRAAAPIKDCPACHMPPADIVIKLNRMDPVAFSHVRHLAADPTKKVSKPTGLSCSDCHPEPFEREAKGRLGMEVPHENGGCAECHNEQRRGISLPSAFAANTRCLTCHKPAIVAIRGK
jgi:c(7)-type cytochrome triheme protein